MLDELGICDNEALPCRPLVDGEGAAHVGGRGDDRRGPHDARDAARKVVCAAHMAAEQRYRPFACLVHAYDGWVVHLAGHIWGYGAHGDAARSHEDDAVAAVRKSLACPCPNTVEAG